MGREKGDGHLSLFETKEAKGRTAYKLFAVSMFVSICLIYVYRATHIPRERRWLWLGMLGAELWFGFFWVLTQAVRWKPVYRCTFKERLSERYENELPAVNIFVCTADPMIEPPMMVINTVLSVMAYDYPAHKLSVYLSDDGGSDLTFYALLEASHFAKHWIPFCKKNKVEPRAPAAYFCTTSDPQHVQNTHEWSNIKKLYEAMEDRIEGVVKLGQVPEEIRGEHRGFSEWNSETKKRNHQTILQILIDGRKTNSVDNEGFSLPMLVYLAREKRPQYHHNFKAGAMNALMRVSSEISNGPIILNVDCDMYSNNGEAVRDALCFFMDEDKGDELGFVQFPQEFENISKNDIYALSFRAINKVDLPGVDGSGGPPYIGTGCFHRRDTLSGKKYTKDYKSDLRKWVQRDSKESVEDLEDRVKVVANCCYEEGTQWGNEMGLKYGCLVEDIATGLAVHCRGWKSVYCNPTRKAFLGLAPLTLEQSLVQYKRWVEGHLQIALSKQSASIQGFGKMSMGHQMSYHAYNFWPLNSFPTLYYALVPPICLLQGVSIFPKITSPWIIPFLYTIMAKYVYSLGESFWCGDTLQAWWNEQRIWLYRRTSSYFLAIIDSIFKLLWFKKSAFNITEKVVDEEVYKRYEQEIMEFGSTSPLFTILATLAMVDLLCLVGAIKWLVIEDGIKNGGSLILQFLLCGALVLINIPIYQGLFLRKDKGSMPTSVTFTSISFAVLVCGMAIYQTP